MPATFQFSEGNEDPRVDTDGISNLNFGDIDAPNIVPADYQIIQGNNSYEKFIRGKFSGTFTRIWKMKFWKSSGIYKIGEIIKAKGNVDYVPPKKTTSVTAVLEVPDIIGNALDVYAPYNFNWLTVDSTDSDSILGGGASGFTLDLWVYLDSNIWLGDGDILNFSEDSDYHAFCLENRKLKCRIHTDAGIFEDFISSNQVPLDTWTHIAFVKDGTDMIGFIDGIKEVGSVGTLPSNTLENKTSKCFVGKNAYIEHYKGNMDEIRVSTIARWVANFVPEVAEYVSDVNTSLLIHCNKINGWFTFEDSSSNIWGIVVDRVYTDVNEKKFGNASAMFAGHIVIQEPGYTKLIVLQLQTTLNADMGDVNVKEFCMQYDES